MKKDYNNSINKKEMEIKKMITVKMTNDYKMNNKEFKEIITSQMEELGYIDSNYGMTKDNNNIFLCGISEYIFEENSINDVNENEEYEIKNTEELIKRVYLNSFLFITKLVMTNSNPYLVSIY